MNGEATEVCVLCRADRHGIDVCPAHSELNRWRNALRRLVDNFDWSQTASPDFRDEARKSFESALLEAYVCLGVYPPARASRSPEKPE